MLPNIQSVYPTAPPIVNGAELSVIVTTAPYTLYPLTKIEIALPSYVYATWLHTNGGST